ncbi:Phosphatidylinositol kinase [Gracilaria domingensis]|nr:Phosphatidylinositol kinase [Gracilaria domingensis]
MTQDQKQTDIAPQPVMSSVTQSEDSSENDLRRLKRLSSATMSKSTFSAFELYPGHLVNILLAPDLEDNLTHDALLAANNVAIFRLLPLILAAIHRIGESPTHRQNYIKLVSVLRMRVAACRGVKLRFLLLIRNPAFAQQWNVKLVHRRDCYQAARHALDDYAREMNGTPSSSAVSNADSASFRMVDSKQVAGWLEDKKTVINFAVRRLLHPEHGIHIRTINWFMRPFRGAFFGTDLVDGIMERANFRSRSEAVELAQRLLDHGLIHKVGGHSSKFVDSKKRIYQCRMALQREDAGHCRCRTNANRVITSWGELEKQPTAIKQIEVQLPMDMVDLQSFEFWTSTAYVRYVDKGYRYGYRAITHPLYCGGLNAQAHLDFSKFMTEDVSASDNTSSASFGSSSADFASDTLAPRSAISAMEINDVRQDSSVIGSVVVRKVFTSIARPMIVELRVPMENADLDEDDDHIILPPGILIKEGDNLMQDLGVEVMFQVFNHIWESSALIKPKYSKPPYSFCYEVFPTTPTKGFMEAMTGLIPLKDYDWVGWRNKFGSDSDRVEDIVRSTVGSYIGAYICGFLWLLAFFLVSCLLLSGRDRHFDNVLVKDHQYVLHIDFGFLMGTSPPIDGPRIAIAPQMEAVFKELGIWDRFVTMCVDAFLALRAEAPAIVRSFVMMFSKAGYEEAQIRNFVQGKFSLNVHDSEKKAGDLLRRQLVMSSGDIKTKFKAFAHAHIDPAWYGLLEKGFPPAVAIMKLVDAKEQKAARKLSQRPTVVVSEEQKIQL